MTLVFSSHANDKDAMSGGSSCRIPIRLGRCRAAVRRASQDRRAVYLSALLEDIWTSPAVGRSVPHNWRNQ